MDLNFPDLLLEVADTLSGEDWLLVGGAMVHLHCGRADVHYGRPTSDVDLVVDPIGDTTLQSVARALSAAGFQGVEPLSGAGALHRFVRNGSEIVDVMGKDSDLTPDRWHGYRVVKCPGSKSALGTYASGSPKELLELSPHVGKPVRIPNVWSAIALKGHSLLTSAPNRQRHVQDGLALLACAHRAETKRTLTNSERSALNTLLSSDYLAHLENWLPLSETHWDEAWSEIRRLRPQGPIFIPRVLRERFPDWDRG